MQPQSSSKPTLLPILLIGLSLASGASSLQATRIPIPTRTRAPTNDYRRGVALKSILLEDTQQRVSEQPLTTIPRDTSITNNPSIATPSHEQLEKALKRQNKPRWLSYVLPSRQMIPEVMAESFGTFILLQLCLGIGLSANFCNSMLGIFPIALLSGMAVTAACTTVSSKCAAHFNPAITLAMCTHRNFGWNKLVPYCMAQLVGATGAALVNYGLYAAKIAEWEARSGVVRSSMAGLQTAKTMGCYFAPSAITPIGAFLAEAFGTFALSTVVFSLTSKQNDQAKGLFIPPIIGSTVALLITILGPLTSASLNPARELGPRLVLKMFGWSSGVAFSQLGIYVAAALVGATAGGWFVDKVLYPEPKQVLYGAFE